MLKNIFYKIIFFKYYNLSTLSTPRSPEWRKLRKKHLKIYPACSVCGSTKNVVPHHIIPFNQDPSKELDPENLISLCENKFIIYFLVI